MRKSFSASRFALFTLLAGTAVPMAIGCGTQQSDTESEVEPTPMEDVGVAGSAITYNGHDYLFVTTPKTWEQAHSHCQQAGGYSLATINDAGEESFLNAQESQRGLYNWWIGANDRGIEGAWVWSNGASSYSNWASSQPDNWQNDEDCATDRYGNSGVNYYGDQWNDWPCNYMNPFVCERDPAPTSNRGSFSYAASNTSSGTANTYNYSLYLYAGQVLTVGTCGMPGASGGGDTYLRINNPSGQEIASNDDSGGPCGLLSNLSIVIPAAGTYVIRAGCFGSGSCNGTVAFNY